MGHFCAILWRAVSSVLLGVFSTVIPGRPQVEPGNHGAPMQAAPRWSHVFVDPVSAKQRYALHCVQDDVGKNSTNTSAVILSAPQHEVMLRSFRIHGVASLPMQRL